MIMWQNPQKKNTRRSEAPFTYDGIKNAIVKKKQGDSRESRYL